MSEEFQFFDSQEDYVMNYLTQIESESKDVLDMVSHKNTEFLFYQLHQYLAQLIRHTVIVDDNYAVTVIQENTMAVFY